MIREDPGTPGTQASERQERPVARLTSRRQVVTNNVAQSGRIKQHLMNMLGVPVQIDVCYLHRQTPFRYLSKYKYKSTRDHPVGAFLSCRQHRRQKWARWALGKPALSSSRCGVSWTWVALARMLLVLSICTYIHTCTCTCTCTNFSVHSLYLCLSSLAPAFLQSIFPLFILFMGMCTFRS